MLGSIKGLTSIKFGIYERTNSAKTPKNYKNDEKYSWLKAYGNDRKTAFDNVKRDIIKVIKLSEIGGFDQIDHIRLPDLFKWKVAFLYSNERLIPIYKRDVLFKIADYFGLQVGKSTTISEIQTLMMMNKPAHLDVYAFMRKLYDQFGDRKERKEIIANTSTRIPRTKRRATGTKDIAPQVRTVTRSYIAEQRHNKIQEALKAQLIEQFGEENVLLEENHVDVKLIQPDFISFYEVKSSPYASQCIKEALGQVLLYSSNDEDKRKKNHIVVGQYPATANDEKYINFLKENLKIDFEYLNVEII